MSTLFIDVEESDNCPYSIQMVFSTLAQPRPVRQVCLYREGQNGTLYDVTGWTLARDTCDALCAPVEDSGQGRAYLVFGGEGGLRLRPVSSITSWNMAARDQWGEPFLLLSDVADIVWK